MKKRIAGARWRGGTSFWLGIFYGIILLILSIIVCTLSYRQKKGELLAEVDIRLTNVGNAYQSLTERFWAMYLPIYEDKDTSYQLLRDYASEESDQELDPIQRYDLAQVLSRLVIRDDRIQWIAVYSPRRNINYIYYATATDGTGTGMIAILPADFPFMEQIIQKSSLMEIYGECHSSDSRIDNTLAIAGGIPGSMDGVLLFGCDTSQIEQIASENLPFSSLQFEIVSNANSLLYCSGEQPRGLPNNIEQSGRGVFRNEEGWWYAAVDPYTRASGTVYYTIDWWELFVKSSGTMRTLLLVIVLLALMSVALFGAALQLINSEVSRIRRGLAALGDNQLDTRIDGSFRQTEFAQIAASINQMAASLKENIDKAYYYQLKHQQAELQELQSKFNPHFLYNSLDLFRARCYENGDDETAELIAQTASIFRTFIGTQTFIPLQQELAFSQRYLAIYRARYSDAMQVLYDIDKEVLAYGIIRNVLQPLIENYFAHGFDPSRHDNILLFRGHLAEEECYILSVEDNGFGMDEESLRALNAKLQEPIQTEKESYGLKNLHQRLQLYYGPGCGLHLRSNPGGGLIADIRVLRKKVEDTSETKTE